MRRVLTVERCLAACSWLCVATTVACSSSGDSGYSEIGPDMGGGSGGGATSGASDAVASVGNAAATTTGGSPFVDTASSTTSPAPPETTDDLRDSACAGWTMEPENAPAVLQLVVDVSGSMDDPPPGDRSTTKWVVTRDALDVALGTLAPSTAAGVLFYPNRDTDGTSTQPSDVTQCVNTQALIPVDILGDLGSPQRTLIDQALQDASPDGLTPTHDAYKYALDNGLLASTAAGRRFMLLITDGAPTLSQNCTRGESRGGGRGGGGFSQVPPDPIVTEIAAAATQGVSTFVIGSPGSEEGSNGEDMRPWLSRAAIEGGTAKAGCVEAGPNFCHFDMTQEPDFAAALSAALGDIVGQIASCNYTLPPPPAGQTIDPNLINAIYTSADGVEQVIGKAPDGACTTGWQLVGDEVVLCPDTCTQVQSETTGRFELLFGCQAVPDIPK